MKIKLLVIGKTDSKQLLQLIGEYQKRLKRYIKFEIEIIPDIKNIKNINEAQQKEREGELIINRLQSTDQLILLDDKGQHYTSIEFSQYLQKKMNSSVKQLVFAIGGPYGFSEKVHQKANEKLSLSKMTFSHQMIRLFIIEQI